VGDVAMWIGLHIFGRGHRALNTNAIFDSSFYWKLGCNKTL